LNLVIDEDIMERVLRIELPFNRYGIDPYGVSQEHLGVVFSVLGFLYKHYFDVQSFGIENVPPRGRAMLVGNHSGGVAVDGAMVLTSMLLECEPPRLAQGMAEKFLNRLPMVSKWINRIGQFTGLPENAARLLEDDRLLMVFPEGARGTAKLYPERNSLVRFGTGFVRLALATKSPIVPFAFIGGGEAIPTIYNSKVLGRLFGAPYFPLTPYLLPLPRPVPCQIYYGKPMIFEGDGNEDDDIINEYVNQIQSYIGELIELGLSRRGSLDAPFQLPEAP